MTTNEKAAEIVSDAQAKDEFLELANMTDGERVQCLRDPATWDEPIQWRSGAAPLPYPTHALPEPMRSFVINVSEVMGTPIEVVAGHALAVVSAATSGRVMFDVMGDGSWREAAALYLMDFTPSGSKKTPGKVEVERALIEAWSQWSAMNQRSIYESEARLSAAKKQVSKREKEFEADSGNESKLRVLTEAKVELHNAEMGLVVAPNPLSSNSTAESLERVVMAKNNGMAFVSETENDFIDNISGRYGSGGANTSLVNKAYSSIEGTRTTRVSDGGTDVSIEFPFLAMGLHLQTAVAQVYADIPAFIESGFFARVLMARPDVEDATGHGKLDPNLALRWADSIQRLVDVTWGVRPENLITVTFDDPSPFKGLETENWSLLGGRLDDSIEFWLAKAHGHVARLAGIRGFYLDPTARTLKTHDHFPHAKELVEFYRHENNRYFEDVIENDGTGTRLERLFRWIARRVQGDLRDMGVLFTRTDAHQFLKSGKGRGKLSADDVEALLVKAKELNWLREVPRKRKQSASRWIAHPSIPELYRADR